MAKAEDIAVAPHEPFALAAARTIRVRADELFAAEENVLDTEDIERVHDMRVASRRLRACLEIFAPCFPKGDFKTVLRDVKALADALGERRDPDVHIDAMRALAADVQAASRPGIEALLARQQERQARGNEILSAALQDARERDLRERLMSLAAGAEELIQG